MTDLGAVMCIWEVFSLTEDGNDFALVSGKNETETLELRLMIERRNSKA